MLVTKYAITYTFTYKYIYCTYIYVCKYIYIYKYIAFVYKLYNIIASFYFSYLVFKLFALSLYGSILILLLFNLVSPVCFLVFVHFMSKFFAVLHLNCTHTTI